MQKWDKQIDQATLNNEKAVLEALKKNYQDALDEINDKIAILLGRQDADMSHVIYQVEYQKALKTQITGILDMLQANEFETISEYLTKSYEEGYQGALYSMQKQGVPLMLPIDQEQVVKAIQHDTMLSESLYNSLGKDIKVLSKQIAGEISRGIATGKMFKEIAKDINGYTRIGMNNAMRIARTEGHRIQSQANYDAQVKAKSKGADIVKIWSSALDGKTRDAHMELDGQQKEVNEPFTYGRHKAMFPGEFGVAHLDINCRCRAISKAKWLLDAESTKMLGDVSKMSDKQKEAIANKLGMNPDDLAQYSNQIIPVKAKDYADFKRQYNKLWHYEGSKLQEEAEARIAGYKKDKSAERVRLSPQKTKSQDTLEKIDTNSYNGGIPRNWKKIETEDDAVKNANPYYNNFSKGDYNNNCPNCAVAYEMRKRGYDVTAKPTTKNHYLNYYPEEAWVNADIIATTGNGHSDINEIVGASDKGARYEISVLLKGYSNKGHILVAENKDGKVYIYDPQSASRINDKYFEFVKEDETRLWRIDNLEVSDRGITACESE